MCRNRGVGKGEENGKEERGAHQNHEIVSSVPLLFLDVVLSNKQVGNVRRSERIRRFLLPRLFAVVLRRLLGQCGCVADLELFERCGSALVLLCGSVEELTGMTVPSTTSSASNSSVSVNSNAPLAFAALYCVCMRARRPLNGVADIVGKCGDGEAGESGGDGGGDRGAEACGRGSAGRSLQA